MNPELWSESDYRATVRKTLAKIMAAFDSVDPDLAEASESMGVVTIVLPDRSKVILSAQPSVRQLWLAIAAQGIAHHFNWDAASRSWQDDKNPQVELMAALSQFFSSKCGLALQWEGGRSSE
jgi:CyaY protein